MAQRGGFLSKTEGQRELDQYLEDMEEKAKLDHFGYMKNMMGSGWPVQKEERSHSSSLVQLAKVV
jgi:predicted TIM-barrel fold metal-dependent hydrolase